ncbi:MAG: hypothetical protein EXS37_20720 [Opitutus sp.]|nr:hypothetical protein [Opitutus sp.]
MKIRFPLDFGRRWPGRSLALVLLAWGWPSVFAGEARVPLLAICAAYPPEIVALHREFGVAESRGFKSTTINGLVFWRGRYGRREVIIFRTGVSLVNAAYQLQLALDRFPITAVLFAGVAGDRHHEYVYHSWNRMLPTPDANWGISDQRFKLVGAGGGTRAKGAEANWGLFDLENDPGEKKNLAADQPARVKALRGEFLRWYGDVTRGIDYAPVPIPVGHADENPVELQASWAKIMGEGTKYVFEAYDWDTIEGWSKPGEAAEWKIAVARGGRYEVALDYGCAGANVGGRLKIGVGAAGVEFTPARTGTPNVFKRAVAGVLTLAPGPATLRAEVATAPAGEVLRLNRLWLRRLD